METSNAPVFSVMGIISKDNSIGGHVEQKEKLFEIRGYLDMLTGDETNSFNAEIQESTHILITDYREDITNKNWIVDSKYNRYDITLVDDPVNIGHHLEVYLKFVGEYNVRQFQR